MSLDVRRRRVVRVAAGLNALLLTVYLASYVVAPRGSSGYSTLWDFWVGHMAEAALDRFRSAS